ncbi:ferredoxin [Rhodococcus sp. WS4]|nr:ferredoxin [Rhodococcus sp. WS4]
MVLKRELRIGVVIGVERPPFHTDGREWPVAHLQQERNYFMSDSAMSVTMSKACIGAGLCTAVAPDHFEFHRGRAQETGQPVDSEDAINSILSAAEVCPAAAITAVRR